MDRRQLMLGLGGLGLGGLAGPAVAQIPDFQRIARDCWIYGLPLIEMATTRARHLKAGARLNVFNGGRALADHNSRAVTTPNNDTLSLSAWIDLTAGPVTVTIPDLGARYWSVAVMDMYSNNNVVLGSRTVGAEGGDFVLVGPSHGALVLQPQTRPSPIRIGTPHAWVLARVLVDGPEDVANVQGLLRQFRLEGKVGAEPPVVTDSRSAAPGDYFRAVRLLMAENPPPATDEQLLRRPGGLLRWGPRPPRVDEDMRNIDAGVAEARKLVGGGFGRDKPVNGWSYPRPNLGDYGQDYAYRAAVALGGLGALPVAEAVYLRPVGEKDGMFHSDRLYRLSLPAKVPVGAFWSLSMYEATDDGQFFFTDNPLKRYAVGDRTRGMTRRADGGLDIWIGRNDPGGARSANWLPAPKAGPWTVTWRGYLPEPELLNGEWRLPAIVKA